MKGELDDVDRAMLDHEARWWRHAGAKESAISAAFGVSATRYYQRLTALLDSRAAEEYAPVVVHRLREQRDALARRRHHPAAADLGGSTVTG